MLTRRETLCSLASIAAALCSVDALAGPRRRARRRVRRRVRRPMWRRYRRHVFWRTVGARRLLVVPLAAAVGWELAMGPEVVVVHEVKTVEVDGAPREVMVVIHTDGKKEQVEIAREDTRENAVELEGTVVAAASATVPARSVEVEVEEEVEVDE